MKFGTYHGTAAFSHANYSDSHQMMPGTDHGAASSHSDHAVAGTYHPKDNDFGLFVAFEMLGCGCAA